MKICSDILEPAGFRLKNGNIENRLSHSENPTSHELAIEMELASLPFSDGP
jgi:hypothetical protein